MRVWRVSTVFAGPLHTDSCSLQVQVDHAPADGSYRTVWRMHLSWTVIAGPNSLLTDGSPFPPAPFRHSRLSLLALWH